MFKKQMNIFSTECGKLLICNQTGAAFASFDAAEAVKGCET